MGWALSHVSKRGKSTVPLFKWCFSLRVRIACMHMFVCVYVHERMFKVSCIYLHLFVLVCCAVHLHVYVCLCDCDAHIVVFVDLSLQGQYRSSLFVFAYVRTLYWHWMYTLFISVLTEWFFCFFLFCLFFHMKFENWTPSMGVIHPHPFIGR